MLDQIDTKLGCIERAIESICAEEDTFQNLLVKDPFADVRFFFGMLEFSMEIGRPRNVRMFIEKIEGILIGPLDSTQIDCLTKAKEWLGWALEYESRNGRGSLLDRKHPAHLYAIALLKRSK